MLLCMQSVAGCYDLALTVTLFALFMFLRLAIEFGSGIIC